MYSGMRWEMCTCPFRLAKGARRTFPQPFLSGRGWRYCPFRTAKGARVQRAGYARGGEGRDRMRRSYAADHSRAHTPLTSLRSFAPLSQGERG